MLVFLDTFQHSQWALDGIFKQALKNGGDRAYP